MLMSFGCIRSVQSKLYLLAVLYNIGSRTGPNSKVVTVLLSVIMMAGAAKFASFSRFSPHAMVTAHAVLEMKATVPNLASFQGELMAGVMSSPCLCFIQYHSLYGI